MEYIVKSENSIAEKIDQVEKFLLSLQNEIQKEIDLLEGKNLFAKEKWELGNQTPQQMRGDMSKGNINGKGISCSITDGNIIEKGGVNFSHIYGKHLPASASEKRSFLPEAPFEVLGISVVMHPQNPFIPTSHLNLRFFVIKSEQPIWWFGGGFDLTPYYGFEEDCKLWHEMAKKTCDNFSPDLYLKLKKECDEYFFLKHRNEPRGIGGIFFDDLNDWGFEKCFEFIKSVGKTYLTAYKTIIQRRNNISFTSAQREFQLLRRGRYVEFNLLYDRGTLFGLQSKGRIESILMSLPPLVSWKQEYKPKPNSPEAKLYSDFLVVKEWV